METDRQPVLRLGLLWVGLSDLGLELLWVGHSGSFIP